ncbi:MAG: ribonuclease HII [Coriobacteriia bacterium]|nr:ribonuclease HII [Coriobacteriia bacterium]
MRSGNVAECRQALASASPDELPALIAALESDARNGVQAAIQSARRRLDAHLCEHERLDRLLELERSLRHQGYSLIAGVDEVGRGALAGPVTAAAAILPDTAVIEGLNDSKRLTPQRREAISEEIRAVAVAWHIAHVSSGEIDTIGIAHAVRRAMTLAVGALDPAADHVIVDGRPVNIGPVETAVVDGDANCAAIAAASVIAKVARDSLMVEYDRRYPGYSFGINKGYGTSEHLKIIAERGLCEIHRRSFAPCGGTLPLF